MKMIPDIIGDFTFMEYFGKCWSLPLSNR